MRKKLVMLEPQRLSLDLITERQAGKVERRELTDAVRALEQLADRVGGIKEDKDGNKVPENRHYYDTATRMIHKNIFGDANLKRNNITNPAALRFIAICEQAFADEIMSLIEAEIDYHEVYQAGKRRVEAVVASFKIGGITLPKPNLPEAA